MSHAYWAVRPNLLQTFGGKAGRHIPEYLIEIVPSLRLSLTPSIILIFANHPFLFPFFFLFFPARYGSYFALFAAFFGVKYAAKPAANSKKAQ